MNELHCIEEPSQFCLRTFLQAQGYQSIIVNSALVSEIREKFMKDEAMITAVENQTVQSMNMAIEQLLAANPSFRSRCEVYRKRNQSRFANARNYLRQQMCQTALDALGPPKHRNKASPDALRMLAAWGTKSLYPSTEFVKLAHCDINLTQVA
jgi:hypothetical protein